MKVSEKKFQSFVYRYLLLAVLFWSSTIGASLFWNISNEKKQVIALATSSAIASFNKDLSFRFWGAKHGGVYVPPTKETPPNPYLAHLKNRDVVTTDGTKLTLMNPAYMIREMMDDYKKLYGITGRIVGKVALNPDNIADESESKAIDAFIAGTAEEVIKEEIYEGEPHLRLIRPFKMKENCVKCHGHLGFKDGDVRGAIGVAIPLKPYKDIGKKLINNMIISHLLIYFLGLIVIITIAYRTFLNLKERQKASDKLKDLNENLDLKVKTRTLELEESLQNLKTAQAKLVETEKMSSLGSLVAGVAHEINTPLGISITGITHIQSETKSILNMMSNEKLGKNALSQYLELVDEMSESMFLSLKNAADIVRSFKQVAIDQHTEEKRKFNLKYYCDEVLMSLHSKLRHTNIKVLNEIDENIDINTYAGIFSQIWTNFIMNSLIHGYEDYKIEGEIYIKGWIANDKLYLTYKDDGKGISKENIKKVFDPFFTTKMGKGGSGLGLNIIYNLIHHKLNGEISCESELNEGMTMIMTIPMKELINE